MLSVPEVLVAVLDANIPVSTNAVARLTLLVDRPWLGNANHDARARAFVEAVKTVAKEEQPIKIRQARLLTWAKGRDLQEAGYPGWTAFVQAFSPWLPSRTRAYVRLFESRLDLVQEAAAKNEIELTVATRAPAELGDEASHEAQRQWLRAAKLGELPDRPRAPMQILFGEDMRTVSEARDLGAILVGGDASIPVIDRSLMEWHDQQLTGEQIVALAREAPPKPERLGKPLPEWKHEETALAPLLGSWVEPTDLEDCVAQLQATRALLEVRRMVLAMACWEIRYYALWTFFPDCSSLEEFCVVHLEMGHRTLQRHARAGLHFAQWPALRKEVESGRLTVDQAVFVGERTGSSEHSFQRWIELVRRLGPAELEHARERDGDRLLKEYGPALDMAREGESIVDLRKKDPSSEGSPTAAPPIGATAERIANHLLAVGATGRIQVALRDDPNRPAAELDHVLAPPGLLAAARYVLAVVKLPKVHGFRRMVEHDRYTCQNPRCRRRTLRVHPHHLHERQHGGTDDPWNIVTLCPACHLRGIHSNQMWVVRIEDWLVWTWPDGGAVVMHSPVSALG